MKVEEDRERGVGFPVRDFCCNEEVRKYEVIFVTFSSLYCVK